MAQLEAQEVTTVSKSAPVQVTQTTKTITPPPIQTEHPQKVFEKKKIIFRTYQVIWYILGVIEFLLAFRIFLRMSGAYPSGFVNLIYSLSAPLALPFRGIIKTSVDEGPVIEWSTFVAMMVYLLLAYGLVNLLQFIKPVTPDEVNKKVDSNA
ncbi:YggT family protein [Candidatus Daviesbacteria bacterium]|nr:YggT family protein [Candidatus Daviesbacteria bacterium]